MLPFYVFIYSKKWYYAEKNHRVQEKKVRKFELGASIFMEFSVCCITIAFALQMFSIPCDGWGGGQLHSFSKFLFSFFCIFCCEDSFLRIAKCRHRHKFSVKFSLLSASYFPDAFFHSFCRCLSARFRCAFVVYLSCFSPPSIADLLATSPTSFGANNVYTTSV